jgi:hypothetical protein
MPDILIRDVPSQVADALTERAHAAGMDRQEWLRQHFTRLVEQPMVKASYTFRFSGPQREVSGYINRFPNGNTGAHICRDPFLTEEQKSAFRQAQEYVLRNEPGDREKAFKLLSNAFEEAFEVPYTGLRQ